MVQITDEQAVAVLGILEQVPIMGLRSARNALQLEQTIKAQLSGAESHRADPGSIPPELGGDNGDKATDAGGTLPP